MTSPIDSLVEQQMINGQEIQKIIRNYKKDSESRKATRAYYEDRLKRLEDVWSLFESVDNKVRAIPDTPITHAYFAEDYYNSIKSLYEKCRDEFTTKLELLIQQDMISPSPEGSDKTTRKPCNNLTRENEEQHKIPSNSPSFAEGQLPQIGQIMRRQGRIIQILRQMLDSATTSGPGQSKQYYEMKIKTISQQWSQVEQCDHKLWELTEDPTQEGYDAEEFMELQERVDKCLIFLATKRDNFGAAPTHSPTINPSTMLKLPKLTLPKFEGDYLRWTQFHDLFTQMVHNQPMPNCQKLWYLKANLAGEAERLIRHFPASEENYTAAWQTLKDRYNNRRLLVTALINKLLSQPTHANDSPSAATIKSLHDTTQECLLGLQILNVSTSDWDPLLLHILTKKLDRTTYALYEQSLPNPREIQSIKVFLSFLENRFQALEAIGTKGKSDDHQRRQGSARALASTVSSTSGRPLCISCKGNHPLFACNNFLRLTPASRVSFVRSHNLCYNCFKPGHSSSRCTLRGCTKCGKKHNTLVHLESSERIEKSDGRSSKGTTVVDVPTSNLDNTSQQPAIVATVTNQNPRGYVLLGTAIVKLMTDKGDTLECRAILDSGSQVNIITERVVKKLNLSPCPNAITIYGVGNRKGKVQHRVNVRLESTMNKFTTRLEAFVLPKITSPQPTESFNTGAWGIPKNIRLADPNFNVTNPVDLLLGAEFYYQLLSVGQIKLADNLPILQNTVLGWVLTGKIDQGTTSVATCGICTEEEQTDQLMERFWKLEEVTPAKDNFTQEERQCETYFTQTVRRDDNGRFIIKLPFREDPTKLGESRSIALNRFLALERRLSKDATLRSQYVEFMTEYANLGHMKEINVDTIHGPHYFLPHHCVLKPDSSTTKLRVVFDASMKTTSQLSLNDIMCAGPTVQSDLFSILLRFRLPRFVFTADIQKMYRQILLDEADQKYQLIFWRTDPRQPLKCYQLCTVTYGTRSAPYLATKCLQRLAQENNQYSLGAEVLKNDFYVDDCISGSNSLTIAIGMQKELTELLHGAGFRLRKWCANHSQLLEGIPPEDQEINLDFENSMEERIKTLGLTWLPKSDQFRVKAYPCERSKITKRGVASDIAKLFDPLGILAPVVVAAKIFSQQLWQLKIDWDAALPMELHTKWVTFRTTLSALNNVTLPRHVFANEVTKHMQIHVFSDASEKAYGAAIYIRSINKDARIIVRLLCAKSRVAPLQKQTVPRLELCAALLAAQLTQRVKGDLNLGEIPTYFWSDSEIVLSWISSPSTSYQTFVANRVANIQELTIAAQWRHVKSKENPADILSRGLEPDKLETCHLWFYGPAFLHGNESLWPAPYQNKTECQVERKRTALATTTSADEISSIIYKINHGGSFQKLQRIVAYMLRFVKNTKKPCSSRPTHNFITCQELEEALYIIIRAIQQDEFKEEITQLKKNKEVHKGSCLSSLTPFLDDRDIIRVGGRLKQSSLSYDAKHPMLLAYSDPLTKLLMLKIHIENLHSGPQALLADTRQRFWPIKGKTIARSVVQHCVTCTRARPKMLSQIMGNLPPTRVQPARPFVNSGVDFCGPIWVHYKVRGKRPHKAYIAVFCCFATKAVHLEIVSDLSTEAFLGSLKRFMGRRGNCRNLYCDNATNFVGARNQLQELSKTIYSQEARESIAGTCSKRGIDFHFIPPRAPHFGGLWEAAVKSAKHLLLKTTSGGSLTYEEMETLVIEIEAILNSRPLTQMSDDPNDLTAITPGHFLIGEPLTTTIDTQAKQLKTTLLARWKLVSHMKHEFWRRWSREYLNELQYRLKWKERCQNINPGTIVIMQDDNLPVMKWPLGRIVQTHKGSDGLVRVADVRTASGILRRPIHKLSPLPCDDDPPRTNNEDTGEPSDNIPVNEDTDTKKSSQRKRDVDKPETPRKRVRNSYGSAVVTLLLACLTLPPIHGSTIDVEHFEAKPGVYFENIGKTNFITTEWSLIVYYDMSPYWMEMAILSNGTSALNHLCEQIQQKSTCKQILSQFEHIKDELETDNTLLSTKRHKRGAIDIVGNVANSLFGVLDSEYARKMSETIDTINENQEHLLTLLKNQTSVIDSTINIIKKDQLAAERKFKELDGQITQLMNRIKHTGEETYELKIIQLFTSLAIQLSLIVSHLQRTQSSIIDVLTDTHHGRISPLLVTPQQLSHELIVIKNHLPPSLRLPADQNDLLQLYKTMSAASAVVNNHVIIKIQIPLVTLERFDLFKMTPIPVLANKTLVAILPCATYIALSPHRDQYYSMTTQELSLCTSTEELNHICPLNHPIYYKGAAACSCEINLFNNSPSKKCDMQKVENSPIWIQLSNPNQWIFAVDETITANARCKEETISLTLKGSGLLKMLPDCVIKHDLLTIQGIHIYPSSIRTSYKKLSELTEITTPERLKPVISNSTPYEIQGEQLEALKLIVASQLQEESLKKVNSHKVHQFTIGYLALLLSSVLMSVLIFKYRGACKRQSKPPKPAPRQPKELDFSIDV